MANTLKEKELKTTWPVVSGLTAETTKQTGHVMQLIPTKSYIPNRKRKGEML